MRKVIWMIRRGQRGSGAMGRSGWSFVALALCFVGVACSGDSTKEGTASVVGKLVEHSKGVVEGIQEGADQGREGVEGTGGARTLTKGEDILAAVKLEALAAKRSEAEFEVTVAFVSEEDRPLHIAGVRDEGNALLIDAEGFATKLLRADATIEVPAKAKTRVSLFFEAPANDPTLIRLWGQDLSLPSAAN